MEHPASSIYISTIDQISLILDENRQEKNVYINSQRNNKMFSSSQMNQFAANGNELRQQDQVSGDTFQKNGEESTRTYQVAAMYIS